MPIKTKIKKFLCKQANQYINVKYEKVSIGGHSGDIKYKQISRACPNENCNEENCLVLENAPLMIDENGFAV